MEDPGYTPHGSSVYEGDTAAAMALEEGGIGMQPYVEGETEEQRQARIERGDLRWTDAHGDASTFSVARNQFTQLSLDDIILDYTLTQQNLNRVVTAFIFCWVAEWCTFLAYVIFTYTSTNWMGTDPSKTDLTTVMWKINIACMLAFQILFYLGRILSMIVFFALSTITLYICITNRKAFQFNSPKE
jgi:hypothetical protein